MTMRMTSWTRGRMRMYNLQEGETLITQDIGEPLASRWAGLLARRQANREALKSMVEELKKLYLTGKLTKLQLAALLAGGRELESGGHVGYQFFTNTLIPRIKRIAIQGRRESERIAAARTVLWADIEEAFTPDREAHLRIRKHGSTFALIEVEHEVTKREAPQEEQRTFDKLFEGMEL